MQKKIAYIMSRFPHLPETFILREMLELEDSGFDVELYPIIIQKQDIIHDEAKLWVKKAKALNLFAVTAVFYTFLFLITRPLLFFRLLAKIVAENRTSFKFLVRALIIWPKAIYAARLMQQSGVNHIHAHYATHPALAAWIIHNVTKIPYSVTVHAHDIYVRKEMLGTKLKDAQFIASISDFNRRYLVDYLGDWVYSKTEIVHCGVPAKYIKQIDIGARRDLGEFLDILTTGSLQPYKGQVYLIEALSILRDKNIPFRCRVIGEGNERGALEQLIEQHQLHEYVHLLGAKAQHEVANLLSEVNCYVQPSIIDETGKMEGIPVALMEALSYELPVIATDISGISELVQPGKTGFLVPEKDPRAMAQQFIDLHQSPGNAAELAAAGKQLVQSEFDLTSNVEKLVTLFSGNKLNESLKDEVKDLV